jgi:DNA-binding transcriptional regulator YiaG
MREERKRERARRDRWDGAQVRALRSYLGLSQQAMADELGIRQQTVSEWETGLYAPRGASSRLLSMVAERAQFPYQATPQPPSPPAEDDRS